MDIWTCCCIFYRLAHLDTPNGLNKFQYYENVAGHDVFEKVNERGNRSIKSEGASWVGWGVKVPDLINITNALEGVLF